MVGEVEAAADLSPGSPREVVTRSVIESIVAGISGVVDELRSIHGVVTERVAVVGGGARVPLLHELLSRRTGLPVVRGSQEATALGNALVQGLAIGAFDDLGLARDWVGTGEPTSSLNVAVADGGETE
jgi:sugar (pentulose or hexulose) kinase